MIHIIEGSNRVGKTTLINAMIKANPKLIVVKNRTTDTSNVLDIAHINYNKGVASLEIIKQIQEIYPESDFVFDRFHLSELVYGKYIRRYTNKLMYDLDKELKEMGAKLILIKSKHNHIEDIAKKAELQYIQKLFVEDLKSLAINSKIISLDNILGGQINEINPNSINEYL